MAVLYFNGWLVNDFDTEYLDFGNNCKIDKSVLDFIGNWRTTEESWFWPTIKGFVEEWIEKVGDEADIFFIDDYGLVRFKSICNPSITMDFRIEDTIFDQNIVLTLIDRRDDFGEDGTFVLITSDANSMSHYDGDERYECFEEAEEDDEREELYKDIGDFDPSLYEED